MDYQLSSLGSDAEDQGYSSPTMEWQEAETPTKTFRATGEEGYDKSTPNQSGFEDSGYHSEQGDRFSLCRKRLCSSMNDDVAASLEFESPGKRLCNNQMRSPQQQCNSKSRNEFMSNQVEVFVPEPIPKLILPPINNTGDSEMTTEAKDDAMHSSFILFDTKSCTSCSTEWDLINIPEGIEESMFGDIDFFSPINGVDFVQELHVRNCYGVLSKLFSYLSKGDLVAASNVSHVWRDVLSANKEANQRKMVFLKRKKVQHTVRKENLRRNNLDVVAKDKTSLRCNEIRLNALANISNCLWMSETTIKANCDAKNLPLLQVGNTSVGLDVVRRKCPRCLFACDVTDGKLETVCTKISCQYVFCAKCFGPHNDKHMCSMLSIETSANQVSMCTKKGRKNLRRL